MIRIDKKALAMAALLASCTTPQIILPPSLGGPRAMTVARGEVCMDTVSEDDNVFVPGIRACREGERGAIGLVVNERINRVAVGLLESGGILVTCSCSGSVGRDDFLQMLAGVAQRSGRPIQLLECRGAAPDHPVSASCLEGEYLKCVIARVA